MSPEEAILIDRTRKREKQAHAAWASLRNELIRQGVEARLHGSLADGRFRSHSDVDVVVTGCLSVDLRNEVQRFAEQVELRSGVSFDLLFEEDHAPEALAEITHG